MTITAQERDRYSVTSESREGLRYTVARIGTGWQCDCPHFVYRCRKTGKQCKHILAVLDKPEQMPAAVESIQCV